MTPRSVANEKCWRVEIVRNEKSETGTGRKHCLTKEMPFWLCCFVDHLTTSLCDFVSCTDLCIAQGQWVELRSSQKPLMVSLWQAFPLLGGCGGSYTPASPLLSLGFCDLSSCWCHFTFLLLCLGVVGTWQMAQPWHLVLYFGMKWQWLRALLGQICTWDLQLFSRQWVGGHGFLPWRRCSPCWSPFSPVSSGQRWLPQMY
jgi:hypothetical protein